MADDNKTNVLKKGTKSVADKATGVVKDGALYARDAAAAAQAVLDLYIGRNLFSDDVLTNSSSTGGVSAADAKNKVSIDTYDSKSLKSSLGNFFNGLRKGTVTYDSLEMKSLEGNLSDIFGRFVTSYSFCDQVVNELLQNGDDSAIHSKTYGVELKKYWEDNASEYENFSELAASWIDLVSRTATNNEHLIDEIMITYKSND